MSHISQRNRSGSETRTCSDQDVGWVRGNPLNSGSAGQRFLPGSAAFQGGGCSRSKAELRQMEELPARAGNQVLSPRPTTPPLPELRTWGAGGFHGDSKQTSAPPGNPERHRTNPVGRNWAFEKGSPSGGEALASAAWGSGHPDRARGGATVLGKGQQLPGEPGIRLPEKQTEPRCASGPMQQSWGRCGVGVGAACQARPPGPSVVLDGSRGLPGRGV